MTEKDWEGCLVTLLRGFTRFVAVVLVIKFEPHLNEFFTEGGWAAYLLFILAIILLGT